MAITVRQNNQNRVVYAFRNDCYMYTVGPKNGVGKLFQPGTRGLVVDDCIISEGKPRLTIRSSNNLVYDTSYGYFAKWTENGNTIRTQSGGYSENWGMDNLILNDYDYNNAKWYYPGTITSFNYDIDTSRYGDKPILGDYALINGSTYRNISLPNKIVYKWEVHVVLSTTYWNNNVFGGISVYLPYYDNSSGVYTYTALNQIQVNNIQGTDIHFAYYAKEISTNLYNSSIMNYPVLRRSASSDTNFTIYVQTKFCFKDD